VTVHGTCPDCFSELRLHDGRLVRRHQRPTRRLGCPGGEKPALPALDAVQTRLVGLLALTVQVAAATRMSDATAARIARATYWTVRKLDGAVQL
jgi:hypothetical protein